MASNRAAALLGSAVMAVTSMCAWAQGSTPWVQSFETKVVMGDGDSRIKARELALDQIKRLAGASAGSVVESVAVLKDERLTEQLRMVSVTLVKLDQVKESLSVENGAVLLNVSARATIDSSELERLATELRQDSGKAKALTQLQRENAGLREDLKRVSAQLQQRGTLNTADELGQRQTRILTAIATNEGRIRQVFERGALLAMADKDAVEQQAVRTELTEQVLNPLMGMQVHAQVKSVVRSGKTYSLALEVGWEPNLAKVRQVLSKYLKPSSYWEDASPQKVKQLHFSSWNNVDNRPATYMAPRVFAYLASYKVYAIISVAGRQIELPVMGAYNHSSFSSCETSANNSTSSAICFFKQGWQEPDILGTGARSTRLVNPLTITLSEAQAAGPMAVLTAMKMVGPTGVVRQTDFVAPL